MWLLLRLQGTLLVAFDEKICWRKVDCSRHVLLFISLVRISFYLECPPVLGHKFPQNIQLMVLEFSSSQYFRVWTSGHFPKILITNTFLLLSILQAGVWVYVLLSCASCNKLSQTGWLKTSLFSHGSRGQKSGTSITMRKGGRQQDILPLETLEATVLFAALSFWWLLAFIGLWRHCSNLCLSLPITFFYVCLWSNAPRPPYHMDAYGCI